MEEIKDVLASCGFTFKKKFGQNFITDTNLLNAIVSLSGAEEGDTVVEIGCGAGTLTRALSQKVNRVLGFEIDKSLQPVLSRTLSGAENTEIIFKDFLKVNLPELEEELGEYRVVANLPYYVTTPVIMKLIEESKKCLSLTVMVQQEVAERLCAEAGTPEYGAITLMIAPRADCRIVKKVSRNMFYPRPNVDSAVVNIIFNKKAETGSGYKRVVQAAFSSRRKTLENNLMNAFSLSRDEARQALSKCGIDILARGETLDYTVFIKLTKVLGL